MFDSYQPAFNLFKTLHAQKINQVRLENCVVLQMRLGTVVYLLFFCKIRNRLNFLKMTTVITVTYMILREIRKANVLLN